MSAYTTSVTSLDRRVGAERAQRRAHLVEPLGAVGEVVARRSPRGRAAPGRGPGAPSTAPRRAERTPQPRERVEVRAEGAVGVGDDRRAAAEDRVAGEHRCRASPSSGSDEAHRVGRVAGRRHTSMLEARRLDALAVDERRRRRCSSAGVDRAHRGIRHARELGERLGVVGVVVRDAARARPARTTARRSRCAASDGPGSTTTTPDEPGARSTKEFVPSRVIGPGFGASTSVANGRRPARPGRGRAGPCPQCIAPTGAPECARADRPSLSPWTATLNPSPTTRLPGAAATVVLLRDGERGLEVLLAERPRDRGSFAGAWVFPGGAVDDADAAGGSVDTEDAARRAAVRETREEIGLELDRYDLVPFSHWTPPKNSPKQLAHDVLRRARARRRDPPRARRGRRGRVAATRRRARPARGRLDDALAADVGDAARPAARGIRRRGARRAAQRRRAAVRGARSATTAPTILWQEDDEYEAERHARRTTPPWPTTGPDAEGNQHRLVMDRLPWIYVNTMGAGF